jgi:hypothetical protein
VGEGVRVRRDQARDVADVTFRHVYGFRTFVCLRRDIAAPESGGTERRGAADDGGPGPPHGDRKAGDADGHQDGDPAEGLHLEWTDGLHRRCKGVLHSLLVGWRPHTLGLL